MLNFQFNRSNLKKQLLTLGLGAIAILIIILVVVTLLAGPKPKPKINQKPLNLTGVVDASFSEANTESALVLQQQELDTVKSQLSQLTASIKELNAVHAKQTATITSQFQEQFKSLSQELLAKERTPKVQPKHELWYGASGNKENGQIVPAVYNATPQINMVSFNYNRNKPHTHSGNYVPANTSVRAVILGGADSDASVSAAQNNTGAMLFKLLEDGTLPNGQRSHLKGCRLSAHSYGDISSERAFIKLYRLSCAQPGRPIIDKPVQGWVFFNGKVGVKGEPLMRDSKIMQWAGISGLAAGISQIGQITQTVQNVSGLGANTFVPPTSAAPFAIYGGASKAADALSQYYIKRADQYHPVIQVGAGNLVTVVFKEGFYLEDEKDNQQVPKQNQQYVPAPRMEPPMVNAANTPTRNFNFTVPPEVIANIDATARRQQLAQGGNFP